MQRESFDSEYLQRLSQRDPETERHFTAYFTELLSCKLRGRLRSSDLIADVTQETFLRVLRVLRKGGVGNAEALGSFVNSVCNNVLFEAARARPLATKEPEDRAGPEPLIDDAAVTKEERIEVRRVLAELPEKDQAILRLLFIEEREKSEICRTLGVDREYLRVLLHRAKSRFRTDWLKRNATKASPSTPIG